MNNLENRLENIRKLTSDEKFKKTGSKYAHIDYKSVIEFLKSGLKMPQIAEIYGCSVQTLRYQVVLDHPEFDARKYVRWGKTEITDKQLKSSYKKLKSVTKMAEILDMSESGIAKRLHKAGVKLRPKIREDITVEEVVRLYEKYKRTLRVANILGVTMKLVRERLKEGGIELDLSYQHERRRTDIPVGMVLRLYDNEKSMCDIAKKYNAEYRTIRKILIKNKRKIRKR